MQKLSRTEKYREYRNKLNNDGEREIATKELKNLQDKIIFNEKRFGNSSRTESDLNRGTKDTSFDDIFSELDKYKNFAPDKKSSEEKDEYISKIKDIINNSKVSSYKEEKENNVEKEPTPSFFQDSNDDFDEFLKKAFPLKDYEEKIEKETNVSNKVEKQNTTIESEHDELQEEIFVSEQVTPTEEHINIGGTTESNTQDKNIAEFVSEKPSELPESQLGNVEIKKPVITHPVPQYDRSKEYEEICNITNILAEKIEEINSFGKDESIKHISNHLPENTLESMQQNIKKDLINSESTNFLDNLQQEVEQYNNKEEDPFDNRNRSEVTVEDKKRAIKKSEISEEMKEEYNNTVSLQVDKIMSEINSSKSDNISAVDIIKDNNIAKKTIADNAGKTIAFELNSKNEVPDNTIILSHPNIEDSSIHTMSFKTEDLDVEKESKSSTLLNVILIILIVFSVGVLAIIIYFFLITRGII